MKPLLIGYSNPTREPDAEHPSRRRPVHLTEDDLETHIHGIGATRSGKSKWLEGFCRQLARNGCGFTLIDPQGELAESLVSYFSYIRPKRPIIYFDPSRDDFLIPFNPFRQGKGDIDTRVAKQVEALLRVWNVTNTDDTPRLGRWLTCVHHLMAIGAVSLNEVHYLLAFRHPEAREYAVQQLAHDPQIQDEWKELLSYTKKHDFDGQVESTHNRLWRFTKFNQIRRIMSLEERSLDFGEVFSGEAIVIANLNPGEGFAEEHSRLLGTLIINELWAAARDRSVKRPRQPYFLLIDEVEKFITPDIRDILDRGAGKRLHLGLFHQHLTQLRDQDAWTYDSIMENARTKLAFGGLTRPNALLMVDELFAGQIDYAEVKFELEQTKFWPVYTRDTVHTTSYGSSEAESFGSSVNADGEFVGEHYGTSSSTGFQEGESDIPLFYPVPFKEVTQASTYTLEEQRHRWADALMLQYQRHFFLRRLGEQTAACVTPFLKPFGISQERRDRYVLEELIKPYALPVPEIDHQLSIRRKRLTSGDDLDDDEPESFSSKRPRGKMKR